MDRRCSFVLGLVLALALPLPAAAHLADGAVSSFDLHATLAKGPVVLCLDPDRHVANVLAALRKLAAR